MFYDLEFLILVLYTQVKIYICDVALSVSTPNKLKLKFEIKPKVAGSIPTAVKQTFFQLARCGHTQSNILYKHISSPECTTPCRNKNSRVHI